MDFPKASELYTKRYGTKTKKVTIGEYKIPIPVPPPDEDCINYGLPKEDQVFRRNVVPIDLRTWDKRDEESYVRAEYHKRHNGIWMFINGRKTYIPGTAYVFFNYWYTEKGMLPTFRREALEFFLFYEFCRDDPDCFGMYVLKPRRIGETEKILFLIWEQCTRWKYSYGGMQNYNGEQSQINFKRLVEAHNKMIYFFKPINRGTDNPESVLDFRYPEERLSRKKQMARKKKSKTLLMAEEFLPQGLESKINWAPTVARAYDGSRVTFYYLDEQGKIKRSDMDPKIQWDIISKTLTLHNDFDIIGFGCIATTVEDIDDGKTVEDARFFWKNSDPNDRNANNRTTTGLYRLFRDYKLAARVDKYGEHKVKEAERIRTNTLKDYERKGLQDKVIQLKRKQPASVEEALMTPSSDCILMPFLLDKRINQINNNLDHNDQPINGRYGEYGNLVWLRGRSEAIVLWVADPNGKWFISQHPGQPNNKVFQDGAFVPGNSTIFSLGVDPIDSTQGSGSEMGMTVYRKFDPSAEQGLEYDDETGEIINPEQMMTDQVICDYVSRPNNPMDVVDDFLKTAIYFGIPGFIEMQKGAYLRNTVKDLGFGMYIQVRPPETYPNPAANRRSMEEGAGASSGIIQLYIDAIRYHVARRWQTYNHIRLLKDMREFNKDNRTERDLTVSVGYALLGAMDSRFKAGIDEDKAEWDIAPWSVYEDEYV